MVEVVVTHDLEDATAERYANAELPVFIVRPNWETVGMLRHELVADDALIVRSDKCPTCREQLEAERRHQLRLVELQARLDEIRLIDDRLAEQQLGDWPPELDRFGRTLFAGIRRTVAGQAIRLLMVGFTQLQRNRWVFVLHLPDGIGAVYAGLGGTEFEPLWSCPYPEFWFRIVVNGGVKERYGEVVAAFMQRHGLQVGEQWRCDLSMDDDEAAYEAKTAAPRPKPASF
ncbi:MAG TPA: hypothetical protein VK427_27845 [Kofleriaceae bacterium]|nr:hypothetical protein [Kofleriaceae bacterium]